MLRTPRDSRRDPPQTVLDGGVVDIEDLQLSIAQAEHAAYHRRSPTAGLRKDGSIMSDKLILDDPNAWQSIQERGQPIPRWRSPRLQGPPS